MDYDIGRIVSLVDQLYAPNQTSEVVNLCQREIQHFQRQLSAPALAQDLLATDKETCQFMGAITYTIFITNHEQNIDQEFSKQIVKSLINCIRRELNKIVIQKMLSNVSKLIIITKTKLYDEIFQQLHMLNMDAQGLVYIGLMAMGNLADELSKGESRSLIVHQLIRDEVWPLAANIFDSQLGYQNYKSIWYDTISSWIAYVSKAEFDTALKFNLNPYFAVCINALAYDNDLDAINLMLELYETNQSLINNENKMKLDSLIFSDWCQSFINNHDLDDSQKLGKLITLHMENSIISLAAKLAKPEYDEKFEYLLSLTNRPELPIVEEFLSQELLNFWILFAEAFDYDYDHITILLKDPQKIENLNIKAQKFFLKLSDIYWSKCHLLPSEELSENEESLRLFRRDISELFEGIFTITKHVIFDSLTKSIIDNLPSNQPLSSKNILDIEASLYLLNSISSVFTENNVRPENIEAITILFDSSYLSTLSEMMQTYKYNSEKGFLTPHLARTTVLFISEISWFYKSKENTKYLPIALEFLFKCLESPIKSDGFDFQETSSKAILKITDQCRLQLLPYISFFEAAANSMLQNQFASSKVKSRVIRSYAAILESLRNMESQATTISKILDVLKLESVSTVNHLTEMFNSGNKDQFDLLTEHLISLLASLTGLAKGLQLPTDWEEYFVPEAIVAGEVEVLEEPDQQLLREVAFFWISDPSSIHDKAMEIVNIYADVLKSNVFTFNLKSLNESIMSEIINFFKAGLGESVPGPFVIPNERILDFIVNCSQTSESRINIHHLSSLMEIYSSIIRSVANDRAQPSTLINILNSVKTNIGIELSPELHIHEVIKLLIFNSIDFIVQDPDLLQASFSMVNVILTSVPKSLVPSTEQGLSIDMFVQLTSLALHETLRSRERFVIKAVCEFWIGLSHNKRYNKEEKDFVNKFLNSEVSGIWLSNDLNALITNKTPTYGQFLCKIIFLGILNNARSNVDFYAELLRVYIGDFPGSIKNWLESAVTELINAGIIDQQGSVILVKKLIVSRGQRVALKLIKDWWREMTGAVDFNI